MSDDFGETTVDREAMTFDEPLAEPARPAPPSSNRAGGSGPAWAGTLASLPAAAPPPGPPAIVPTSAAPTSAAPTSAAPSSAVLPPAPPPPEPPDPTDFARTNVHQRAVPVSVEPPIDELSEHDRILAALPKRGADGAPGGSDVPLYIGLAIVVVLVLILVLVLVFGLSEAFLVEA